MQELVKTLRRAASCQPNNADLFNQAADAIEKLKHLEAGAIEIRCTKKRWADELESIKRHKNKIKAEAIREAAESCAKFRNGLGPQIWTSDLIKYSIELETTKETEQ